MRRTSSTREFRVDYKVHHGLQLQLLLEMKPGRLVGGEVGLTVVVVVPSCATFLLWRCGLPKSQDCWRFISGDSQEVYMNWNQNRVL